VYFTVYSTLKKAILVISLAFALLLPASAFGSECIDELQITTNNLYQIVDGVVFSGELNENNLIFTINGRNANKDIFDVVIRGFQNSCTGWDIYGRCVSSPVAGRDVPVFWMRKGEIKTVVVDYDILAGKCYIQWDGNYAIRPAWGQASEEI